MAAKMPAASEAAMLALSAVQGDWCYRSDIKKTFRLVGTNPTVLGHWGMKPLPRGTVIYLDDVTGEPRIDSAANARTYLANEYAGPPGPEGPEGPPGADGAGVNVGTAVLDFGAFPGKSDASIAVTGQSGIVAGSIVNAWIRPVASADHSADEHMAETIKVNAGNIVAGTGFTIYGWNSSEKNEPVDPRNGCGGRGTRLSGVFNINWSWS